MRDQHHGRRFGNHPHEEKKEEGPSSCPSTPRGESIAEGTATKGSSAAAAEEAATTSQEALLLSPAKTATTVVTSSSSSPLADEDDEDNEGKGGRRRGPEKYRDDVRYTYLSDVVPCAAMSPEVESPGASELTTAHAAAPALVSTLPIPLPPLAHLPANHHLKYYRVVYRGVVALLSAPSRHAPRSGAYLSYGEVFATSFHDNDDDCESAAATGAASSLSPRRWKSATSASAFAGPNLSHGSSKPPCLPMLPTQSQDSLHESDPSALRVDYVITGGYANELNDPTLSSSSCQKLGFLFTQSANGDPIVEEIETSKSRLPPSVSAGPWTYKIVSTAPVPTVTGPCSDAPRTAAMLLPGTVHDVSLCFDNKFLRLQHRRGWFRLYREVIGEGGIVARIPTAELVRIDETDMAATSAGAPDPNAADISMASHSTSSSYSTLNTSFASASTMTQRHRDRRRHRPPRRTLEHDRGDASHGPYGGQSLPRHVPGVGSAGSAITSPSKQHQQHLDERCSVSLVSDDDEGESSEQSMRSNDETVYLMRVLHPKGLKILDAPQYAASHLIHGSLAHQHRSSSAVPHRVFSTLPPMRSNPVIVFDSHSKTRRLPTGVYFEARSLLQQTMVNGEGLVQLFDKTGWAMVPSPADVEMVAQSSLAHGREWVRVMVRSGLAVAYPPLSHLATDGGSAPHSPSSIRTATISAAESTSDVASSVGSAFLDVFRTPKKKKPPTTQTSTLPPSESTIIPCGTMVHVERVISGEFARLVGGQGWIPTALQGKPVCARLPASAAPEVRRGSFWFRVQSPRGIRVRVGPSRRAPSIKSAGGAAPGDKNKDHRSSYFRFECGEFLRASEIVTLLPPADPTVGGGDGSSGAVAECYCKLFRNRHANLLSHQQSAFDYLPLEAYTTPAEWVQVYHGEELFLEECAHEPHIERHKSGGWKYEVLREVCVRKGPSFASESTGTLAPGDSITVNERVAPPTGSAHDDLVAHRSLHWLRLKDGQGWVHDTCQETGDALLVPHSLRHHNNKPKKKIVVGGGRRDEVAYNAIIARLFHHRDDEDDHGDGAAAEPPSLPSHRR
jgi:hypothetical protein